MRPAVALLVYVALAVWGGSANASTALMAGFAAVDITPDLDNGRRVYLAGYGMNRKATGVHDRLYARTVVLAHGSQRIAIASVDVVGLQYPAVKAVREKLPGFRYVVVASTHNHEGPDVIGIWGKGPFHRGVDDDYLDTVVERIAQSVRQAAANLTPVSGAYGTAEDESLLADNRLPDCKDGVLRVLRLNRVGPDKVGPDKVGPDKVGPDKVGPDKVGPDKAGTDKPAGLLVQWNCHPESLGSQNKLITADFPWATVAALEKKYACPVVYVSGAVGGLMTHPAGRIKDDDGGELLDGTFEYAAKYGEAVAGLAEKAIASSEPIELLPLRVESKVISAPVQNALYRAARAIGVMRRDGHVWTGDFQSIGKPMTEDSAGKPSAVETEVAYLQLGDLHIACVPGELYPELVYGEFAPAAAAGVDFPDAELEPTIAGLMPGKKWLLLGLANDELGYIIPKRQWDKSPPYAYGADGGQYGEINSCGPEIAPIIMQALQLCLESARGEASRTISAGN